MSAPAATMAARCVSVAQFRAFCKATGAPMQEQPDYSTDDHAVVNVTWHDATACAAWMGTRLPTDAEWQAWADGLPPDDPRRLVNADRASADADVWEWTTSEEDGWMVVRGGSWPDSSGNARCACRGWFVPLDRFNHLGFRVVVGAPAGLLGSSGDTPPDLAAVRAALDAIERRASAATPGPWDYWFVQAGTAVGPGPDCRVAHCALTMPGVGPHGVDADAAFIAHARDDIPALLAVARAAAGMGDRPHWWAIACDSWYECFGCGATSPPDDDAEDVYSRVDHAPDCAALALDASLAALARRGGGG